MGLFSTTHQHHSHDNSTHIRFPNTIEVNEHKAPTDESIRLMEEAHDKAIKNIIAKVKVEDNLVNGEAWCFEQPWNLNDVKIVFKFKINGHEFTVEKELSRYQLGIEDMKSIAHLTSELHDSAKAFMLWYALKMLTPLAYKQITGNEFPKELL